jgi:hypothetical protein
MGSVCRSTRSCVILRTFSTARVIRSRATVATAWNGNRRGRTTAEAAGSGGSASPSPALFSCARPFLPRRACLSGVPHSGPSGAGRNSAVALSLPSHVGQSCWSRLPGIRSCSSDITAFGCRGHDGEGAQHGLAGPAEALPRAANANRLPVLSSDHPLKSSLLQWAARPAATASMAPAAGCCTASCNLCRVCSALRSLSPRTPRLTITPRGRPRSRGSERPANRRFAPDSGRES